MFDFVICDRSPISVQRIMDKKFDEDVDVCEKRHISRKRRLKKNSRRNWRK